MHRPLEQVNWVRGSQVGKAEKIKQNPSPTSITTYAYSAFLGLPSTHPDDVEKRYVAVSQPAILMYFCCDVTALVIIYMWNVCLAGPLLFLFPRILLDRCRLNSHCLNPCCLISLVPLWGERPIFIYLIFLFSYYFFSYFF